VAVVVVLAGVEGSAIGGQMYLGTRRGMVGRGERGTTVFRALAVVTAALVAVMVVVEGMGAAAAAAADAALRMVGAALVVLADLAAAAAAAVAREPMAVALGAKSVDLVAVQEAVAMELRRVPKQPLAAGALEVVAETEIVEVVVAELALAVRSLCAPVKSFSALCSLWAMRPGAVLPVLAQLAQALLEQVRAKVRRSLCAPQHRTAPAMARCSPLAALLSSITRTRRILDLGSVVPATARSYADR